MTCSICLEDLNENIMALDECGHSYHTQCIENWLQYNVTCPMCRKIVKNYNFKGEYLKYPWFPLYTQTCTLIINDNSIEIKLNGPVIMKLKLNKIKTIIMYENTITFMYNISENSENIKKYSFIFKKQIKNIYDSLFNLLNSV